MRLLDQIAQSRVQRSVDHLGRQWSLPCAADFSAQLSQCPLRWVLNDELVRLCVQLAYSQGDELAGCLDLIHVPAESLWIEWSDGEKRAELARIVPQCQGLAQLPTVRKGVLISCPAGERANFRSCRLRTFWSAREQPDRALVAAAITHIDLDEAAHSAPIERFLHGDVVTMRDPADPSINALLQFTGFTLDPAWQDLYLRSAQHTPPAHLVGSCLAGVAFDLPMVLALFLLMSLRSGLTQQRVDRTRLNAKRARLDKPALLEHIEVSCPVLTATETPATPLVSVRDGPRLHHVRGHLVRRDDSVFWRRPHWRGHLRLGCVRTRTVDLQAPKAVRVEELAVALGRGG